MIGVIDAENQSSVVHENLVKTVGIIKDSALNLTVGCILFFVDLESDFHK
jgi:hypothetical protein